MISECLKIIECHYFAMTADDIPDIAGSIHYPVQSVIPSFNIRFLSIPQPRSSSRGKPTGRAFLRCAALRIRNTLYAMG